MTKPPWLHDKYFRKAKKEGYKARSVFKLKEIQEKFCILKTGDNVLDLGSAPGSFLQYISQIIGNKGKVIGIDLLKLKGVSSPNISHFQCDIFDTAKLLDQLEELEAEKFDVITSDLAPATSGIKTLDQARSVELDLQALRITEALLKKGGNVVLKVLQGEDFPVLTEKIKQLFQKTAIFKPFSSRDRSKEIFVIGMNFKF